MRVRACAKLLREILNKANKTVFHIVDFHALANQTAECLYGYRHY